MPWTPLAERFADLPLILSGPILRRTEPEAVTVWLALKKPQLVTLRIYSKNDDGNLIPQFEGTHHTIRLGDHLHIVAVTARATNSNEQLARGRLYYYNLFFQDDDTSESPLPESAVHLYTPGILNNNPDAADLLHRLVYPGHLLPGFVLPAEDLNQFRVLHGSCRKPDGIGKEMLSVVDLILEAEAQNSANRPQQLFLTGDQIYADDVAAPLLFTLIDAGKFLLAGNKEEVLPLVNDPTLLAPGQRTPVVRRAMFTTTSSQNQLLTLAEYIAMYLFVWSDVLWPQDLPTAKEIWSVYPGARPQPNTQAQVEAIYAENIENLRQFKDALPQVRRALANIPTYMICDDHDVTDDWFLDGRWCQRVLANPLGKRIVRNALLAYSLFQAWGNIPDQFAAPNGQALLEAIDTWRGDESDARVETITEIIGLPDSFGGSGELQHSERSLHWNYTVDAPHYQIIVIDSRTQRFYRSPGDFPGLLSPNAIQTQVVEPARTGVDVTIFISATPVLGIDAVQSIQFVSHFYQNNYAKDLEAWALELSTFEHFLKTVSAFKRVVFLAGDVHYAFGSSLAYWDQARQVTAKMINYTSSPLRNEGKDIGLLSTLYPELLDIFGKEEMPAIDFFAWDSDTLAHNQQLRRKIRGIILAQAYQHWWLVPRLLMALQVAALHSQYEIVLAAEDWPKGSLRALPPDRSYRIRYLPDRRYQITEEAFPEEMKRSSGLPMKLAQWWLNVLLRAFRRVTFTRKKLSKTQNKIANRVVAPQGTPAALPQGTHHIARGTRKGLVLLENRLKKAEGLLRHAILDRQDLLSKKAGLYVVGYANLGEIGFHWSPKEKEVLQRLWWWHPNDPQKALPATEYCETLELPQLDEDPALS